MNNSYGLFRFNYNNCNPASDGLGNILVPETFVLTLSYQFFSQQMLVQLKVL